MTPNARRARILAILFLAAGAFGSWPREAQAQWGMGGGFGWGWGGFSQVPKPESFINSKALIDAGRDTHIPSRNVYAHNANSYINHIRDNGFVERYDVARADLGRSRYAPPPTPSLGSRSAPPALTATQYTPSLPLASFYNAESKIVWPADAPVAGDLKEKQQTFDQASQTVLAETKKSGVASIATVTEARQKLLDYGRPALQYARTRDTPRVADTFHLFLLSLYESLAQAVNPATNTTAQPSTAPPAS